MPIDDPTPLHPRTVEAMAASDGRDCAQMIRELDETATGIVGVLRGWSPEKHAEILKIVTGLYDDADPTNHTQKAISGLAMIKLSELISSWHAEVRDGLNNNEDAGGDKTTADSD